MSQVEETIDDDTIVLIPRSPTANKPASLKVRDTWYEDDSSSEDELLDEDEDEISEEEGASYNDPAWVPDDALSQDDMDSLASSTQNLPEVKQAINVFMKGEVQRSTPDVIVKIKEEEPGLALQLHRILSKFPKCPYNYIVALSRVSSIPPGNLLSARKYTNYLIQVSRR